MILKMTLSQHEQYTGPETDPETELNGIQPFINCIIYPGAFPTLTCQNAFIEYFEVAISVMLCLAICQAPNCGLHCI